MKSVGFPEESIESFKDVFDCNIYFLGEKVAEEISYVILSASIFLLLGVYIALNFGTGKRKREK